MIRIVPCCVFAPLRSVQVIRSTGPFAPSTILQSNIEVKMLPAYHGGNIYHNSIDHDFSVNLNPLGMPEMAASAAIAAIKKADNYPDPDCGSLSLALCSRLSAYDITPDMVCFGNGASELINSAAYVIASHRNGPMLITAPTFSEYERAAINAGISVEHFLLPGQEDYILTDDILDEISDHTGSVFLCNPNNPTGRLADPSLLLRIAGKCSSYDIPLFVDECFINLSSPSDTLMGHLSEYSSLVILRAFTKTYAMPALRLGYMVSSNRAFIKQLMHYLPTWNVSLIAQEAGVACLGADDYIPKCLELIRCEREWMLCELKGLGSIVSYVYPSDTCFIMFRSKYDIYTPLLNEGILIRDCSGFENLSDGTYRVCIKSHDENALLISALQKIRDRANDVCR